MGRTKSFSISKGVGGLVGRAVHTHHVGSGANKTEVDMFLASRTAASTGAGGGIATLVGGLSASRYVGGLSASRYDGISDQAAGQSLTGITDGKEGLFIFAMKVNTDTGIVRAIIANDNLFFNVRHLAKNTIKIDGWTAGSTHILQIISTSTINVATGWIVVMASWDLVAGISHMFFGNIDVNNELINTDDIIDYARTEWSIGAATNETEFITADLSELWFNTGFFDISVEANRRKIVDANGNLVFFGINGELIIGTQPLLYAPDGNPVVNKGTGGNFIDQGSITSVVGPNG